MIDPSAQLHPLAADDPEADVGTGTAAWQFAVVTKGATIGRDCRYNAHDLPEGGAVIGDRVTLKCGTASPSMTTSSAARTPRSPTIATPAPGNRNFVKEETRVRRGASIGAGAVILPGLTAGRNATP